MSKIQVNNQVRDMTVEEENQRTADIATSETEKIERENLLQAKIDLKASAKAKLIAGEALTEDEANTIVI